jgi:glycosyltransferase involved in cell wall biosynthesis
MTPVVKVPVPAMSVVVPTHGRTDLFRETLASLERQTLASFEVVVTDDSDRAEDRQRIETATRGYQALTGRPAHYVFTTARLGQARNTNQGLAKARGEFVRILHSDDLLAPRSLEAEVALLRDRRLNLQVLYHLVESFVKAPRFDRQPVLTLVQPSLFFRATLHSSTPLPSATAFRRCLLDEIGGGMREDFDFLCDWELLVRLIASQHRQHRFLGRLTPGFVGWRVHPNSTTGRLWHRHFLEHEQMMEELRADDRFCESIIGDRSARDGFFATAARYRYRRLAEDVARMPAGMLVRALPRIARCAGSSKSVRERLRPGPWTFIGKRRYPRLVVPPVPGPAAAVKAAAPGFIEPRAGMRFALGAYTATAIINWGKTFAARQLSGGASASPRLLAPGNPDVVAVTRQLEVHPTLGASTSEIGTTYVITDYNNSTNLWPLRQLLANVDAVTIHGINNNAFVEPALHNLLKLTRPGTEVRVPVFDNHHLTSFGFKALIDRQYPGQFTWVRQSRTGPAHQLLRYRRTAEGHRAFAAPHTGWTFGMLTTGKRLANVERFIDSIEQSCDEAYEIIIVSPVGLGDLERRRGVRVLLFAEHDDLGWITRKKNVICSEARYSDILVCHDRFWLDPGFVASFKGWGYAYGLAAVRVHLPDGRRGLDWGVVSSQNHVWSTGGLLDYRAYSQYAYNPGGATLIRKAYWRDFPWNENVFWNEHEDVELCRRIQRAGGIIGLAAGSLVTAEDRWVGHNPRIPYCDQNEVLYGRPVGEQRITFLETPAA